MKHCRSLITFFFIFLYHGAYSQQRSDSTFSYKESEVPVQLFVFMPKLVDLNYSLSKPNREIFKSKDGQEFSYDAGVSHIFSTEVILPVIKTKKKFAFTTGFQYCYFHTQHQNSAASGNPITFKMPDHATYAKLTLSFSQGFKIGNQSMVLSVINSMVGNEFWSPNQATGVLSVSFPLQNTPKTSFALSLFFVFPKYKSFIPVPSVIYATKLRSDLMLDIFFPLHTQLRYILKEGKYFTGGLKLIKDTPPQYQLSKNYGISENIEINSLSFALFSSVEYHLSGLFWLSGEMGYRYMAKSRIVEPARYWDNYLFIYKNSGIFYGNVGIFIRPTFKKAMSSINSRKH